MDFDVLIVGAGLAGASLAASLRGSALSVGVVEGAPPRLSEGWDARIYAISPASKEFLDEIGAWAHLDHARIGPVYDMRIFGDRDGRLDFSSYDCGLETLAWIVESGRIQMELWETIKRQHRLTLLCPARPAALAWDEQRATLTLEDGRTITARLVVGADGANSWVRRQGGIAERFSPYGEKGVVANFACELDHAGCAMQWFLPEGILAWLPLPEKQISMVWSAPDALADELTALSPEALCARVADAGGRRLGALTPLTAAAAFPLRLMRVERPVAHRLALIGDAAHAIHPLSGHGINLGFQDARALAARLASLPSWRDPGERAILDTYARARAEETLLMQYTTDGLNRLFRPSHPLIAHIRNLGLNLTNALPVIRNMLVRYAVSGHF
ncbi:MAG: UbiH/UbiF family hydroxylase [Rhodocyclaceae bacterium]|nr:UbiH/UbiF family hydroxylase [Rhodocyclaceae bacterium]